MELIDRKPFVEYANEQITGIFAYPQGHKAEDEKAYREKWEFVRNVLMSAPTVELKPIVIDGEEYLTGADYNAYLKGYKDGIADSVKHGRWVATEKGAKITAYKCSKCGRVVWDDTGYDVSKDYPYCHCGADMRGGENDSK